MAQIRDTIRGLRADLDRALAEVAAKHKLTSLKSGNATYDVAGSFTIKVEGVIEGGKDLAGARYEREARSLTRLGDGKGIASLPPLGTVVELSGGRFEVVGMKPRGTKILIKRVSDGALMQAARGGIERAWARMQ